MELNKGYTKKVGQSIEKTLDKMMEDAENMFPYIIGAKSKYFEILEYLFCNQDYILTPVQINYLLDYCRPPLCQSGEMCFPLLAQMLRSAERTNDLNLICKVYINGVYLYENHEYNAKKIELLKGGIDYFLSKHADQNVGELYLKIAESCWVDEDQRMNCCAEAIKYLAKNTEQYAHAITLMQSLQKSEK